MSPGAIRRALRSGTVRVGALVLLTLSWGRADAALAQQPDSIPPGPLADSTALAPALAASVGGDTLPDSLRVVNLVAVPDPDHRRDPRTGVWEWDREALEFVPGLSLADLLRDVPGLRVLQAGDYGAPAAVTAFGAGPGRVRVYQDGIELVPMEGRVIDLGLVGLSGLDRVRVERSVGGIDVELESRRFDDPRPYTRIEAGTGDLETNFFRGTFALPRAPGGNLLLTIDRIDTRGRENEDAGTLNGVLARYSLVPSERFGAEVTLLRRAVERALYVPLARERTDWMGRMRAAPTEALALGLFAATSSLETEDSVTTPSLRQVGVEASWERESVALRGALRRLDGEGVPTWTGDVTARMASERIGEVSASVRRESWTEGSTRRTRIGLASAPHFGLSVFAESDRGTVALSERTWGNEADSAFAGFPSAPGGTEERNATRWGASFENRGVLLRGARVRIESDSLHRYGLPFDAGEGALAGGTRDAWEAQGELPLLIFDGLSAVGSAVLWDDEAPWPYTPRLQYDARLRFHDTFLPTGNFELLVELGVREREPMSVFGPPDPDSGAATVEAVPFHQSWFARLHMRIVSVQLFVQWENLTVRGENQDFPDRLLPQTRAYYGVRWGLWN